MSRPFAVCRSPLSTGCARRLIELPDVGACNLEFRTTPFDQQGHAVDDEVSYLCDACGEEIVIPVDPSGGKQQEYVEDCPVCCRPNVICLEFDDDGDVRVSAHAE